MVQMGTPQTSRPGLEAKFWGKDSVEWPRPQLQLLRFPAAQFSFLSCALPGLLISALFGPLFQDPYIQHELMRAPGGPQGPKQPRKKKRSHTDRGSGGARNECAMSRNCSEAPATRDEHASDMRFGLARCARYRPREIFARFFVDRARFQVELQSS